MLSLMSREKAEDAVIRHFEKTEELRKIIMNVGEKEITATWEGGYKSLRSVWDWMMNKRR